MTLESKPLKEILEADLQELINEVKEGKMIDYKRGIIGHTDEDKKEFCR